MGSEVRWSRRAVALGRKPHGLNMLAASVRDVEVYVTV